MEVKIGVAHAARELVLESGQDPDEVTAAINAAVKDGSLLSLHDDKGRTVIVPGAKIAYVELGVTESRRVGFGG